MKFLYWTVRLAFELIAIAAVYFANAIALSIHWYVLKPKGRLVSTWLGDPVTIALTFVLVVLVVVIRVKIARIKSFKDAYFALAFVATPIPSAAIPVFIYVSLVGIGVNLAYFLFPIKEYNEKDRWKIKDERNN